MERYELVVYRTENSQPLIPPFPAGTAPFGAFSTGDALDLRMANKGVVTIDHVWHAIVPLPTGDRVHKTMLFVSPRRNEDHPVPWPW
jgi:hypothetical protein